MKILTVIGGSNGIGRVLTKKLKDKYDHVNVIDIVPYYDDKISYIKFDMSKRLKELI